ncbi:RNA helicase [Sarracenia purpurea var. burkii]
MSYRQHHNRPPSYSFRHSLYRPHSQDLPLLPSPAIPIQQWPPPLHHPPSASLRPQPPFSKVELQSRRGSFRATVVESLIAQCNPAPHKYFVNSTGHVAGRLFFRRQSDAVEAVAFFWERRLAGDHFMTPVFEFLDNDLKERVNGLFVSYVKSLLQGDIIRRMEKKTKNLKTEAERLSVLLRKPKQLALCSDLRGKRKGIQAEIELNSKRMKEFRSAMKCILSYIEGNKSNGSPIKGERKVFQFEDCLDWSRIHHIVIRECRRLDDGLPIYGFRVEILRKLLSEQVCHCISGFIEGQIALEGSNS